MGAEVVVMFTWLIGLPAARMPIAMHASLRMATSGGSCRLLSAACWRPEYAMRASRVNSHAPPAAHSQSREVRVSYGAATCIHSRSSIKLHLSDRFGQGQTGDKMYWDRMVCRTFAHEFAVEGDPVDVAVHHHARHARHLFEEEEREGGVSEMFVGVSRCDWGELMVGVNQGAMTREGVICFSSELCRVSLASVVVVMVYLGVAQVCSSRSHQRGRDARHGEARAVLLEGGEVADGQEAVVRQSRVMRVQPQTLYHLFTSRRQVRLG